MEDKVVVKVPSLIAVTATTLPSAPGRLNQGQTTSTADNYGTNVGGPQALGFNLIQFLVGAPVVDYDSITFSSNAGGGQLTLIDTSRRSDLFEEFQNSLDPGPGVTYGDLKAANTMARSPDAVGGIASVATGEYSILTGASSYQVYDGVGGSAVLMKNADGNTDFDYNVFEDAFTNDSAADFHFTLVMSDTHQLWTTGTGGPTTGAWGGTAVLINFSVINPDYNTDLNWIEACSTYRHHPENLAWHDSAFYFDTYRGAAVSDSDPLSDVHCVGLDLILSTAQLFAFPLERISGNRTTARGGNFYTNTVDKPSFTGAMTGGRHYTSGPFEQPNQWTMMRGPGYVRIFSEHAGSASLSADPALSNVYYLGLMEGHIPATQYESPVAMLTDTRASSTVSPWWRKFDYDDVVVAYNNSYRYDCPFILNENFKFGEAMDPDTDLHFLVSARSALNQPNAAVNTGLTKATGIGSSDDSAKLAVSQFDAGYRETQYDTTMLWHNALQGIAQRMTGTRLEDRYLERVVFYQMSEQGLNWYTANNHEDGAFFAANEDREAMGALPGVYWVNDKLLYAGATRTDMPDDDVITMDVGSEQRTLRIARGYASSTGDDGVRYAQTTGEDQGCVAFDMNEV